MNNKGKNVRLQDRLDAVKNEMDKVLLREDVTKKNLEEKIAEAQRHSAIH